VPGRAATVALVVWSAYMAVWATVSDAGGSIAALWWLAGVAVLEVVTRLERARRQPTR
jgi:hypothetical protein